MPSFAAMSSRSSSSTAAARGPRGAAARAAPVGVPRYLRIPVTRDAVTAGLSRPEREREARDAGQREGTQGLSRGAASTPTPIERLVAAGAESGSDGQPLAPTVRARMQTRLGVPLTDVRIHADSHAAALAGTVGANALTIGQDVYFGSGAFAPESETGDELLAHELAHTVQHGNDRAHADADLARSIPATLGVFEIDMADRVAPAGPGLEGHITFSPDPTGPYSAEIGLVQAARVLDVAGASTTAGAPWHFGGGEAPRNEVGTTGTQLEPAGVFIDALYSDPAHAQGAAVSPSYPSNAGLVPGHNELGWLRSPTDWHEARLYDYPSFGGNVDYEFETVARGMDSEVAFGALNWGFKLRAGVPTDEYAYTSAPSATFDRALDRFRGYFTHEPVVIYFDTEVDAPAAGEDAKLAAAMTYLTNYPDVHVVVEGHADERGAPVHNVALSDRRANFVAAQLLALGLDAARIDRVQGTGSTTTFAAGHTPGQQRANRRAVVTFVRTATTGIVD
jgi:outer membrane protein OmpA-like peptidoglycan-associated protein